MAGADGRPMGEYTNVITCVRMEEMGKSMAEMLGLTEQLPEQLLLPLMIHMRVPPPATAALVTHAGRCAERWRASQGCWQCSVTLRRL